MTAVTNNTNSASNAAAGAASSSAASSSSSSSASSLTSALGTTLTQSDFLKLMTAQLQAQDPTNPVDNNEFVQEMAQFSQLSETQQIDSDMNTFGSNVTGLLQNSQVIGASDLINKPVLVTSSTIPYSGSPVSGGVNVSQAGDVTVTITDSNGNTINTIDLGQQQAGVSQFTWNGTNSTGGTVSQGTYNITAQSGGTQETTMIQGTVTAAGYGGASTGTYLTVSGLGNVPLSSVAQLQ